LSYITSVMYHLTVSPSQCASFSRRVVLTASHQDGMFCTDAVYTARCIVLSVAIINLKRLMKPSVSQAVWQICSGRETVHDAMRCCGSWYSKWLYNRARQMVGVPGIRLCHHVLSAHSRTASRAFILSLSIFLDIQPFGNPFTYISPMNSLVKHMCMLPSD